MWCNAGVIVVIMCCTNKGCYSGKCGAAGNVVAAGNLVAAGKVLSEACGKLASVHTVVLAGVDYIYLTLNSELHLDELWRKLDD